MWSSFFDDRAEYFKLNLTAARNRCHPSGRVGQGYTVARITLF